MKSKKVKIETLFDEDATDLLLDGDIDNVIKNLQELKKKYPQYKTIKINIDYHYISFAGEKSEEEIEKTQREKDFQKMEELAKKLDCTIMINEYQ